MTLNQRIIWTALPNGLSADTTKLDLTVFVSPRLFTDEGVTTQHLSQFPDWVVWPKRQISFSVDLSGTPAGPVSVTSPAPNQLLWELLFNGTTFVQPFVYASLSSQTFNSYPSKFLRDFLVGTYASLASETPTAYPTLAELGLSDQGLTAPYGQLPITDDQLELALHLIQEALASGPPFAVPPGSAADTLTDFEQAEIFLSPVTAEPATYNPNSHPAKPFVDFHRMVSTLGQYPSLLRLLGLAFDLEVPVPSGGIPSPAAVTVTPSWTPLLAATTNFSPSTYADPTTFLPLPQSTNPEIAGGYLRMSDAVPSQPSQPAYAVLELDVEGSVFKSLNFARGVWRATTTMASSATPSAYAPPALRSGGMSVAHTGAALAFGERMQSSDSLDAAIESSSPYFLYAEDITRGVRVDVWDDATNLWHQLCARQASPALGGYVLGRSPNTHVVAVPPGEEGWLELTLTGGPIPGPTQSYLTETLFRWAGWSLVAPRPGQYLSTPPEGALTPQANNPPTGNFPLQVSYAATPGTLPPLRFGRTYSFRGRAVDLAGNSLPFTSAVDPGFAYGSTSLRYGRLEPIQSPPLVLHDPRGELSGSVLTITSPGEHLERLVIRSESYDTVDGTQTPTSRHVVPPAITEEMAEMQGLLDTESATPDPTTYSTVAPLANASYGDAAVMSALGGAPDPGSAGQPYYPVDNLAVPYLPDGLARGAVFSALPGLPSSFQFPFANGPWPGAQAFRIEVQGGSGAPVPPGPGNNWTLTVFAPKATYLTTQLSCFLNPGDLESMALWEWLEEAGLVTPALQNTAISGSMFWFTPFREVTIVHAVRQPLTVPQFTSPSISRDIGKTFALLSDTVKVDYASSQKIDVYSVWAEPFDDGLNQAGSVELNFNGSVGEVRFDLTDDTATSVTFPSTGPPAVPALRQDFGDTKYRLVYYEARSTSRFLEYFEENVQVTLTNADAATVDPGGMATGTVVVASATTPEEIFEATTDYVEDDVAGTITAIEGGDIIPLTGGTATVNVTYVPPPVTRSSLEEVVAPATATGYPLVVPSTARPAAPDVRYVLSLFSFAESTTTSPPGTTSARSGNAVRVYLGRPWWSSGDDEQLGVLIFHNPPGGPSPYPPLGFEQFSTRYGRDPLFVTNPVLATPSLGDFSGTTNTASELTIPETGSNNAWDVAGYAVGFDPSHQLWFADVHIDTAGSSGDSYWPFVRLGLVRYQPNSLSGVECSTVVMADFVKLASDRTASVVVGADGTTVSLSVVGVSYTSGPSPETGPSQVFATVEVQQSGVSDPDLQWTASSNATGSAQLSPSLLSNDTYNWTGTVTLPAVQGSQPFRIRLEEFEAIGLDTSPSTTTLRRTYIDTIQI